MFFSKSQSNQDQPKSFEWKLKDFTYIKVLGEGSFGKVKLASHSLTKKNYAVKILRKKDQVHNIKNLEQEILALQQIDSPFIVKLNAVLQDEKKIYIIQEFIDCGELEQLIQQRGKLTEEQAKFYFVEICCALEDFHKLNIVSRDLKPSNILLTKSGHIKLCDFGLCKILPKCQKTYSFCGTLDYNPPEVFLKSGTDIAADYWALGVILYELLSGQLPFYDHSEERTQENICDKQYPIHIPDYFSKEVVDVIKSLFERNTEQRSKNFQNLKNHPWLKDVFWKDYRMRLVIPPIIFKKDMFPNKKYVESIDNFAKLTDYERKAFQQLSTVCKIPKEK